MSEYTIIAHGEDTSISHIEIDSESGLSAIVKAFDAVNSVQHISGCYEPLIYLWEGHLEEVPSHWFLPTDDPQLPVNDLYYEYRIRSNEIDVSYTSYIRTPKGLESEVWPE